MILSRILNPHHPRMLCAKFGSNWSIGSEGEVFKKISYIFAVSLLFPLGKWLGLSFVQTWIHFTQRYVVPSLVEIGPVVPEKKINMKSLQKSERQSEKLTKYFSSGELKSITNLCTLPPSTWACWPPRSTPWRTCSRCWGQWWRRWTASSGGDCAGSCSAWWSHG